MSVALTFLLGHLRLVGYLAAFLALLIFVGWIGHLRHTIEAQQTLIASQTQAISEAKQVNDQNVAELGRLKAENAKAQIALAEADARASKQAASVATIHSEIAHVKAPAAPASIGPYLATAIDGLRRLKAADSAHENSSREGAGARDAAAVPAGPKYP